MEGTFPEPNPQSRIERIERELNLFIAELLRRWDGEETVKNTEILMQYISLFKLNYETMSKTRMSLYGQYTVNPETVGTDYETKNPKIKILDPKELENFVGKKRYEVVAYVIKTYGDKYNIPGVEYWKYLSEDPSRIPSEMKEGNKYYFMGSTIRACEGDCLISSVSLVNRWLVGSRRGGLNQNWQRDDQVVLLEK